MYVDNAVHSTLNPMDAPSFMLSVDLAPMPSPPMTTSLVHLLDTLQQARSVGREVLVHELARGSGTSPVRFFHHC